MAKKGGQGRKEGKNSSGEIRFFSFWIPILNDFSRHCMCALVMQAAIFFK